MPSIASLISRLKADFPNLQFEEADEFRWSPPERTVYFDPRANDSASLLHELSHAILEHMAYTRDVQLIEMERDAWQFAKGHLSPAYAVVISEDAVENALDTYRDWLHARSTCPNCSATGIQSKKFLYKCLACHARWKVNDARFCALRRYTLTT